MVFKFTNIAYLPVYYLPACLPLNFVKNVLQFSNEFLTYKFLLPKNARFNFKMNVIIVNERVRNNLSEDLCGVVVLYRLGQWVHCRALAI